jgi:hypothetical protein
MLVKNLNPEMKKLVRLLKFATFYLERCSFDANFMNSIALSKDTEHKKYGI